MPSLARTLQSPWFILLLAACGQPPAPAGPEATTPAPVREVAVTFDDLVIGGRILELPRMRTMTADLLRTITAEGVPAVGFVNEAKLCDCDERSGRIEVLRMWAAAGLELANHTYSHPSLTCTPLADYQADVLRGEPVTRALMAEHGKPFRWFRHPYLHTGPTLEVRAAFEPWLAERGYTVAPVTLDNSDWMFNFVYTDAKTRGDAALMRRVGEAFIAYVDEVMAFYESAEQALFARPIRHVLLLHANELNADWFDDLAALLRRRGYRFITLEAALQDPAYREPDRYAGPAGVSWMYRWDFTRGREQIDWSSEPEPPAFVRELYDLAQRGPPRDQNSIPTPTVQVP
jgi:peptidoglycan/xylan/chitin deacetylase (PgdA/CDA1 family)